MSLFTSFDGPVKRREKGETGKKCWLSSVEWKLQSLIACSEYSSENYLQLISIQNISTIFQWINAHSIIIACSALHFLDGFFRRENCSYEWTEKLTKLSRSRT